MLSLRHLTFGYVTTFLWALTLGLFSVLGTGCSASPPDPSTQTKPDAPNIVFILADDMGYGDVKSFNKASKISTPHLDRLAAEGMRLTDAHAPGSWCTPTRYGLMTGQYPFRDTMRAWNKRALIDPGQVTVASLLKKQGYATGMVGKWHLGFEGASNYDCSKPLEGGPTDHGFDHYFGIPTSLDIPPYFYIRGDECVDAPTQTVGDNYSTKEIWTNIQGPFWRGGKAAPGFKHKEVLPRFQNEAVSFLERRSRSDQPFFLYLALPAPHTPWLPEESYRGVSNAGMYGDFASQVDGVVGEITGTLEQLGLAENTLVIFTSDNGPVWYPKDEKRFDHRSTGKYRGMKGDAWEGGHRMPFIARWPGQIPKGSVSGETTSFTDMLATFAAITNTSLPSDAGEDSYNIWPVLQGETYEQPLRPATIHTAGHMAIRKGAWKLITGLGSGGFTKPRTREPKAGEPQGQLYNLESDPSETQNVYQKHPQVVKELTNLLEKYQQQGYSRPMH